MQTFIASVFVFGLLILVHELGHYFVARLTGIKVLELAIGFGPKIFGWTKNNIDYSLRAVPLGGFCRLLGESPEEAKLPDSFPQKPVLSRAAVLIAGAAMNLFLAILVFFIIFFFIAGAPVNDSGKIGYIVDDFPAQEAGLQTGDIIRSIEGQPISGWEDIITIISARPEQAITVEIERDGSVKEYNIVTITEPGSERGIIGIGQPIERFRFLASLGLSFERFGMVIASIFQVLTGQAPLDVAGPVGIVFVIGEVAQTGFVNLLLLTALISISLGIMNLLPIPALDGGRLLFLMVEAVRGKKIDPEKEGMIHFIGFALLIVLILFITYQDILRFFIAPGN